MHVELVIIVGIVVVALMVSDFKAKDKAARAEGLAPLSHAQQKAARKAERPGRPYTPRRRAYGTPPKIRPGTKRYW